MSKEVFGALEWLLSTTKSLVSQKSVRNLDEVLSHCEKVVSTQAAANKAAEEGALPAARAIMDVVDEFGSGTTCYISEDLRAAIAADRASRHVANKAEVEPAQFKRLPEDRVREIAMDHLHDDTESAARNGFFTFSAEGLDGFAIELMDALATPPATTGASTAPVETFIELRNRVADLESQLAECMKVTDKWASAAGEADGRAFKARDQALEEAAALVEGCDKRASVRGISIAIRALKVSVGASTVLTDERITDAALQHSAGSMDGHWCFKHKNLLDFAREVAAQAGQVAVPGWLPIESAPRDGSLILLGRAEDEVEDRNGESVPGRWHEEDHDGPDNMGHDAGFMDDSYQGTFFCGRSFGCKDYQNKGYQPTHWMPLPPSPAKESK